METTRFRNYFLGKSSSSEVKALELEIISDSKIEAELQIAESALIEDYLEESLDKTDQIAFEEKYLITKERREQLEIIRQLKKYSRKNPASEPQPSFFESLKNYFTPRRLAIGFGSLALVLTLGVSSYLVWKNYSSNRSEVLISLNKAYQNERPTEARITDLEYAPKTEGTRGGNQAENLDLVLAKSRATEAVLKNPSAENLHELGRVFLAENNYDEAIKQFEKALKLNSNYAKLHNDLGVALMEQGKRKEEGKLKLFAKANESFEKSIELDKNLKEAYFNRALAIELLNLPNQAKEAWEEYLKLDSTSKWADEARERLKKLEANKPISKTKEEILKEFFAARQANETEKAWQIYSSNREMVTGKLIPQQLTFLFVEAKLNGNDEKSREYLQTLELIGRLEEEKTKDLFWKSIAGFYQQTKDFAALQKAHKAVFDGYHFYLTGKYDLAQNNFLAAKNIFLTSGNIWESKICDYWIATLLYRVDEIKKSTEIFKELADFAESGNYKWLSAQANYKLATNVGSVYQLSKQIEYGKKSLKNADEIQDIYQLQKTSSFIADQYKDFGRYEISLSYAEKGLSLYKNSEASLRQKWRDYNVIAGILFSMKLYRTSALYQTETLILAKSLEDKTFLYLANLDLAAILSSQKKYGEAIEFIGESRNIAESIENKDERLKAVSYSKLKLADLKSRLNQCEEAIELYNQAISFYDISEWKSDTYQAHKGRLLCYLSKNDDQQIQPEIPVILELFGKYRKEILEEQNRNVFFDNEQDIYDLLIGYEHRKNNTEKAFDYAEESRSRSLLDMMKSGVQISEGDIKLASKISEPLKLPEIRTEMPEAVQILQYTILEDKILIYLIDKENFHTAAAEISAESLQEKVTTYLETVKSKSSAANVHSEELYRILISPIQAKLNSVKRICLIPDKALFQLPFAALVSPETKKYLLDDYGIMFSPSANVFIAGTKNAKEKERYSDENLFSIGNPDFSRSKFSDLPNLPAAEKEAQEIIGYYQAKSVLIGKEASKQKVKEALPKANIIHFAGHYVVDENSPMLSNLVLNGEDSLANYELISEKLSLAKLIVLSACQTGVERFYKGEGMIGASRTFLATGVPLVVASQWAVDSDATKEIMTKFHYYRKSENLSSADALRKAQIEMINGKNENYRQPYYWAAFMVLGGYANF
jgi:CHAT domain-containing protein/Flp pilus assembly protein TadD